jgi:hypothetical protein
MTGSNHLHLADVGDQVWTCLELRALRCRTSSYPWPLFLATLLNMADGLYLGPTETVGRILCDKGVCVCVCVHFSGKGLVAVNRFSEKALTPAA